MSDLFQEQRISLSALARREGLAVSTVWRWTLKGCRGVVLENYSIGAKRYTTEESFLRFIEATTAAAQSGQAAPKTNRRREAAIRKAEAELQKAGV